jgi:hypothetical protein
MNENVFRFNFNSVFVCRGAFGTCVTSLLHLTFNSCDHLTSQYLGLNTVMVSVSALSTPILRCTKWRYWIIRMGKQNSNSKYCECSHVAHYSQVNAGPLCSFQKKLLLQWEACAQEVALLMCDQQWKNFLEYSEFRCRYLMCEYFWPVGWHYHLFQISYS